MTTVKININTINDVKDFVTIVSRCEYDVDTPPRRHPPAAKPTTRTSSPDPPQQPTLKTHSDDRADFLDAIKKYIVK